MLSPRRSMAEKVAIAQDTPTQVEQSLPLRGLTSWDETNAKHAEIAENSTVKICVTSTIDIDVEEGKVTIKVQGDEDKSHYLSGSKLNFLFLGLLLSIFLVALDQNIVATALPVIASYFNSLDSATWIVSAHFLTQVSSLLPIGQMLTIVPTKWIYLSVIALFEIGTLFSAVAPSMNFLIFGRAVAGVGASGIFTSVILVTVQVTRLEQRPILFGAIEAVFAFSSVIGSLLGGAFTDHVSWRWCFYVNLPLGVISVVAIGLLLDARPPAGAVPYEEKSTLQKFANVDWVGSALSLGMVVPLLLALQWGGNQYPWDDKAVIACFCVFAVALPAFLCWEYRIGDRALMPLKMFGRSTVIGCSLVSFFVMFNLILGTYYLPLLYQAVKEDTATKSGLDILPFMIGIVGAAAITGGIISFTGHYWGWLFGGGFLSALGAGLLYTVGFRLIGYQILYGVGIGCTMQNTFIAIQCEFSNEEDMIPQATSVITFFQLLGGAMGISIAGTVFANTLESSITIYAPSLPTELITGVRQSISVISFLPSDLKDQVIVAYVHALDWVFMVGVPTMIASSICVLLVQNHHVKERGTERVAAAAITNVSTE